MHIYMYLATLHLYRNTKSFSALYHWFLYLFLVLLVLYIHYKSHSRVYTSQPCFLTNIEQLFYTFQIATQYCLMFVVFLLEIYARIVSKMFQVFDDICLSAKCGQQHISLQCCNSKISTKTVCGFQRACISIEMCSFS